MLDYHVEPWKSTYKDLGEINPRKLQSRFVGRDIGAFRTLIPPRTIEPPQVHLIAPRDGNPFEELLTDFNQSFLVAYFDPFSGSINPRKYDPGQDISIPEYIIPWLINEHDSPLEFTCECAPFPWKGDIDEPEFPNLPTTINFLKENRLVQDFLNANRNFYKVA